MKNRPWLIIALAAVVIVWSMYQSLGRLDGIRREPEISLGVIGIFVLIMVPFFWFQYRRLKREPIYVEVQAREQGEPPDPRLGDIPLVLVASRTKMLVLLVLMLLSSGVVVLMMWGQPGICRVAGIASFAPLIIVALVGFVFGLIRPERLEIAPQGLKHVSFWRSRLWSWDEIRNIIVIKGRGFGFVWTSGICFNRFATEASASGPSRPVLKPIWPMHADQLAALLNDARLRWSSARDSNLVAVRKRFAEYLYLAWVWLAVGVMLWVLVVRPCGP